MIGADARWVSNWAVVTPAATRAAAVPAEDERLALAKRRHHPERGHQKHGAGPHRGLPVHGEVGGDSHAKQDRCP